MHITLLSMLCASALLLLPRPVLAQASAAAKSDGADKALVAPANLTLGAIAGVPANNTNVGNAASAIQFILEATSKEKVGTVAIGWRDGQGQFQLSFSSPLDSNGSTEPISLVGLPTGAAVKLSFNRLNWRGPTGLEQLRIIALCQENGIKLDDCDVRKLGAWPILQAAVRELHHLDDRPWLIGFDGSVERTKFVYLTKDTLESGNETDQTLAGSARLGYFIGPYGFLFGSYVYKRGFRPGSNPTEICQPIGTKGALKCDQTVIGKPQATTRSIGSLELRKFFVSNAAIAPSVQYDFREHISAVDVPVYFIKSDKGIPTGGVRFAWRSDTKEVTASLFIGAALSLLP